MDIGFIKLSNVSLVYLKGRVFLVSIIKRCICRRYKYLMVVACKRLTLSVGVIFVIEHLFVYIYFLLFEENRENRISRTGEKMSNDFALFCKMIA